MGFVFCFQNLKYPRYFPWVKYYHFVQLQGKKGDYVDSRIRIIALEFFSLMVLIEMFSAFLCSCWGKVYLFVVCGVNILWNAPEDGSLTAFE